MNSMFNSVKDVIKNKENYFHQHSCQKSSHYQHQKQQNFYSKQHRSYILHYINCCTVKNKNTTNSKLKSKVIYTTIFSWIEQNKIIFIRIILLYYFISRCWATTDSDSYVTYNNNINPFIANEISSDIKTLNVFSKQQQKIDHQFSEKISSKLKAAITKPNLDLILKENGYYNKDEIPTFEQGI